MNAEKWSKFSSAAEVISSVAILLTLIFLAVETRQNTNAIEATTRQQALNADTQFLVSAINNPEMILAWSKPELTDEELVILNEALILFFRNRENDFAQYQRGVMDADTWERYSTSLLAILAWQRNQNWWNNFGRNVFEPSYVAEVDRILSTIQVMPADAQIPSMYRDFFGSAE